MDINKEQEPNYWGIMGADVRYNDKLSSSQKIMYVEITALSNSQGYSWATNSYFARLYNVTTKTVSSWIKSLEKEGLIRIEYDWGKGKQVKQRRMYPVQMPPVGYAQKGVGGMEENVKGGMHKKVKENTINPNTIKRTGSDTFIPSLDEVIKYFDENGYNKEHATKMYQYYNASVTSNKQKYWKDSKGNQVKNWKQKCISVWFKDEGKSNGSGSVDAWAKQGFKPAVL